LSNTEHTPGRTLMGLQTGAQEYHNAVAELLAAVTPPVRRGQILGAAAQAAVDNNLRTGLQTFNEIGAQTLKEDKLSGIARGLLDGCQIELGKAAGLWRRGFGVGLGGVRTLRGG